MLQVNLWQVLSVELATLAVLVAVGIIVAKPGERRFFIGLSVFVWAFMILTVFGLAWYTGWMVLVT